MKIVVTGAAGFIGSHLSEKLKELGHDVVGIDCFTDYYAIELKQLNAADLAEKGIPVYKLDLAEDDLTPALEGVDFICHLAAQPGISATTSYDVYIRNNLNATHRLLEAAKKQESLKLFVNTATSSIYGKYATEAETAPPQPTSYYGVTKLAAEQLALAYYRDQGFPACSLRVFSALGP
jgi:nucleoside-diphosphate-sugar epimerase